MDENAVVRAVCSRLRAEEYIVESSCNTNQRGVDVIARNERNGVHCYVEAKGGTSSREGSARFGRPYTRSQIFDRVAKGVFTCLQLRSTRSKDTDRVILAVPDEERFQQYIRPVETQLREARIEVWYLPNAEPAAQQRAGTDA